MNKYALFCLIITLVSTISVYAERWPFDFYALEYLYPQYTKFSSDTSVAIIPTAYIASQGLVYASTDAKVIKASTSSAVDTGTTDEVLILETSNGLHIVYYGISPMLAIGSTIKQGDIVGTATVPWYMRIFDIHKEQWADPFSIFPILDIPVIMKLYNFSFIHQEKNDTIFSVSDKILYAGNNTIDITLSVLEMKSQHYTIPQFIRITLQDTVLELWRNDILQRVDMDILNNENRIVFSLSDIGIKKGYFIADIFIYHSKMFTRNFRFSLRAK